MSVIVATDERLQEVFNHLSYIISQDKEISLKIIKSIDENYKSHLDFLQKYNKLAIEKAREHCLFDLLVNYKRVNHVEYILRYSEKEFDIKPLELEELENLDNIKDSEKDLYENRMNIGSLLYNIGEYVNLPTDKQNLLDDIYNIYIENKEVKKKESEQDNLYRYD